MNRKQRRAMARDIQKKQGIKFKQAYQVVETYYDQYEIEEGTKVRLNYELMKRHSDWKKQREDFKKFVEDNKDKVFTVEYDKTKKENHAKDMKTNVCLAEDTTEPKWLFWTRTLVPIASAKIKMDDGTERDVELGDLAGMSPDEVQEKIDAAINLAIERDENK